MNRNLHHRGVQMTYRHCQGLINIADHDCNAVDN